MEKIMKQALLALEINALKMCQENLAEEAFSRLVTLKSKSL